MFNPLICFALILAPALARAELSLVEYLAQPAAPLDAEIVLDEENTQSMLVTASTGGTLSLVTANGDSFKLTIPPGALASDMAITMTAISSFAQPSLGFASAPVGVQLGPEGLAFLRPATLSIIPAKPIAMSDLVPMTADEKGQDLRLASLSMNAPSSPGAIDFALDHFSPYSITGSPTIRESILKAFNRSASARIGSWFADQIVRKKNGQSHDPEYFDKVIRDSFEFVVKPQIGSIESCEGGLESLATLSGWTRQCALLGYDTDGLVNNNFKAVALSRTAHFCRDRAIEACYHDHRPFDVITLAVSVERQNQLLGIEGDPIAKELMELATKCARFQFVMDSTMSMAQDETDIATIAHAEIDVWLEHIFSPMKSKGTIQVKKVTADIEGLTCNLVSLTAPSMDSQVSSLFMNDLRFDQSLGVFLQGFYPYSKADFICRDESDPPNIFPISFPMRDEGEGTSHWGGLFLAIHSRPQYNDYNLKKGRYEIFKWNVLYGEKFAEKKFQRSYEAVKEDTTMTIYHRPQQ